MSSKYNAANKVEWCTPDALHTAAKDNDTELLKALIDSGELEVDFRDKIDWTPLMCAANANHIECVKMLLEAGANPNAAKYDRDDTALSLAAERGSTEILETLLNAGADMEQAAGFNETPLMCALHWLNEDAFEFLISKGANVDHQSTDGYTALMICADGAHDTFAYALLRAGADTKIKNKYGETAEDIAIKRADKLEGSAKVLEHIRGASRGMRQNSLRNYVRRRGPKR